MLQNIFFYLVALPATWLFCSLAIIVPKHAAWSGRTWARVVVWATRVRFDVDLSALDPDQHYVFMANHQSQLDIPVLNAALAPRRVGFVAKQSLFSIPLFGPAIASAGHIPIDRSNSRRAMKSIEEAVAKAKAGAQVVIFPEGTRAVDLEGLQEFKVGGMIIALKTGMPVAPIIVTGTGRALPKHRLWLSPATVKVRALAPIDTSAYTLKDRERFMADLHRIMDEAYRGQLRGEESRDAA